ncbi:MAG: outer membrane lipoprotein chaperone LolA [Acidimicrobiia bacterium]|nr:outer membrane lipoprotein chaperone LolA [Acidimicrobiia bacterium]
MTGHRRMAYCLALSLITVMGWGHALGAQSAAELVAALQRKYDAVRDFSADFEHVYTGGVLRRQLTERGRLQVKKPGRMRWEYTAPEKKTFVSDSVKLYAYIPADRQVMVSSVPQGDQATTPALFLAGQGNLARDFITTEVVPPKGASGGTRALKLVPKTPQAEFQSLVLTVDAKTLGLRGLESTDAQSSTSSFLFINLKENVGLSDKDFVFAIPRGVDVISEGGAANRGAGGGSIR